MSYVNGNYSAPASSFNPAVTNTAISSTDWAALLADLATALSTCMLKDGTQTVTASIPMAGFKLTGLGAGIAAGQSVRFEQVLTVGARGTMPYVGSTGATALTYIAPMNSLMYGNTYSNNASDATNDLDIAAGGCIDATGAYWMQGTALTKQSDVAWAVGSGNGGLDTGSVGNSDYYIWRIARSDTGVVDILYSLSSTAPTMPSNYDFKRLIGWFKRVGVTIVAFHTYETEGGGIEMRWDAPTVDVNLSNTLTTARRTDAIKVPLNFSVIAELSILMYDASGNAYTRVMCPDETDAAVDATNANIPVWITAVIESGSGKMIRTSSTGTIAARSSLATIDTYKVRTDAFRWARR